MTVLVADAFSADAQARLADAGLTVIDRPGLSGEDLAAALAEHDPQVLVVRSTKVSAESMDAARGLELIVRAGAGVDTIDVAGASERGIFVANCPGKNAAAVAELVVVPTRPSPHDLRAVGATVDLCERAGKPLIFVVNGATPKARITSEAAVALSQHGTVAPVTLHHRTDFAASMIDGRTVMEIDPDCRSSAEVAALWNYVADRLEKNFRRTVFSAPGATVHMPYAPRQGGFGRRIAQ